MSKSEELEELIRKQRMEMRAGGRQWPERGVMSLENIGLFLDQDGRTAREGGRSSTLSGYGGRFGDRQLWKLKTGSYVPIKGCRKYPKEHGQQHMISNAKTGRRCGKCYDEYNRARTPGFGAGRGGTRFPRRQCGHPEDRQKQRYRNGKKNGTQCLECMKLKARERRQNG